MIRSLSADRYGAGGITVVAVAAVLLKSFVKVLSHRLLSRSLSESDSVASSDTAFLAALEKLTTAVAQNTQALERIAESVDALTQQQQKNTLPVDALTLVPSTPPVKRRQVMIESSPDSRCGDKVTALAEYVEDADDIEQANEVPSLMDLARGSASSLTSPVAAAGGMLSQQIFGE